MVLQNNQNFTEMTSNMIYIVAFGVGLKCLRKIHFNTQCVGGGVNSNRSSILNRMSPDGRSFASILDSSSIDKFFSFKLRIERKIKSFQ